MQWLKLVAGSIMWVVALCGFVLLALVGLVPPRSVRDERSRAEAARPGKAG